MCEAVVSVPSPTIVNPCDEVYTITNDSPYKTSDTDASGIYPIGTTTFTWTITDASGTVYTCEQSVTVNDLPPHVECPADYTYQADFEVEYKDNITVADPTWGDNCPNPFWNGHWWNLTELFTQEQEIHPVLTYCPIQEDILLGLPPLPIKLPIHPT